MEGIAMEVEGEESVQNADMPSHLNTLDTRFLEVSKEKLTVKYIGKGSHSHDVGISFTLHLSIFAHLSFGLFSVLNTSKQTISNQPNDRLL
jgi:hypothetical protein